jgi:pimeloyl-ACP methyl ester carboxylesterase
VTHLETGIVEVNGGRLEFDAAGHGPPVVFLHPGLWDRRTWDDQFGVFAKPYRVVRYDARGYGRSSRPEPGRPYSRVDDLAAVMDAAAVDRAALVGCSMGGGIGLDFALVHPDRVSALVLAAPGLSGFEGTPEEEAEWEAGWGELERTIDEATAAGELDRAQDLRLTIWASLGTDDDVGRRIREIAFDNLHEITMDESGATRLDPPAIDRLEDIRVPTLVLPADHDPPWHLRICELLGARIPDSRLVRIPDTDHVVNMRQPEEFNRVVFDFLGQVLG